MTLWKEPRRWKQSVTLFFSHFQRQLATLINRTGQFFRRNNIARITAGLVLLCILSGVIVASWRTYRARLASARGDHLSADLRQLADLRPIDYYDVLEKLTGLTQTREERKDLKSDARADVPDVRNTVGSTVDYRDSGLQELRVVPAVYEESVADNTKRLTYPRNVAFAYGNPGGVVYLTSADPAALGPFAGDYLVLINKPQAALDAFRQRLVIDEQTVAVDPNNVPVQTDLAYSSSRIGDLLAEMGDEVAALPFYQRAADIYAKNASADPQDFATTLELSRLLAKLAKTHTRLGYIEKASAECDKAADLVESITVDVNNVEQSRG